MLYKRIDPTPELKDLINCYWIIENPDKTIIQQKIIPDGFIEIIFHYGEPYKLNLSGNWEIQSKSLFAGQITKHFFLQNTCKSGMLGIKLNPTAMYHLFNLSMDDYTNKVVDLKQAVGDKMDSFIESVFQIKDHDELIKETNQFFLDNLKYKESPVDRAVNYILEKHGMVTVSEMCEVSGVGERQLQILFKKQIGLSPKLFARIKRFSYIFQLVENNNQSWSNLAYDAAYYDQSHFIRNFKDFTGENPASYAFDEKNIANFFLKKM